MAVAPFLSGANSCRKNQELARSSESWNLVLSVDLSLPTPVKELDLLFLSVKAGMTVIVQHLPEISQPDYPESWWMADVIFVEAGALNPKLPTLFQVAEVDLGIVRWFNADPVTHIVPSVFLTG